MRRRQGARRGGRAPARGDLVGRVARARPARSRTLRGYVRLLLRETKGRDRGQRAPHRPHRPSRWSGSPSLAERSPRRWPGRSAGASRLRKVTRFDLTELVCAKITREQRAHAGPRERPRVTLQRRHEASAGRVGSRSPRSTLRQLDLERGEVRGRALSRRRSMSCASAKAEPGARSTVTDDGPGDLARCAPPHVFEPFQRYSAERGGLGLGLAIAQRDRRAARRSHLGREPRTRRDLPRRACPVERDDPSGSKTPRRPTRAPRSSREVATKPACNGTRLRILVVDDEPNILGTLRRALELEGFRVEVAGDGEATALREDRPTRASTCRAARRGATRQERRRGAQRD